MQHLFQSTFLQSLGFAIAGSLWQTALLWLVYMSLSGLVPMSAAAKYRLAVAAQVTGFAWFLVSFSFYYHQYSSAWDRSSLLLSNAHNFVPSQDVRAPLVGWLVKGEQFLPYVSAAYLLLLAVLLMRWITGFRETQLIRKNSFQKMPAEWRLFVERVAAQLGIRKKIQLFLSDSVHSPLTMGFLKPMILIPLASINHLTTEQLEAVLLHELAHIRRCDYLVNMVLSIVEIGLFFNPFTQLLSKSIRKERENSCDDWVLQFRYDASAYAEALLRIAYLQAAPCFAMAAAAGKKNELLVRVKRMIDRKDNRFNYRKQLLAFVVMTGILSSIAWLNPLTPRHAGGTTGGVVRTIQQQRSYAIEPMTVRVDNPLFNPMFFLSRPLKEEISQDIASAQKEIAELHPDCGLVPVETITPLVADALQMASGAMQFDKADWPGSAMSSGFGKDFHFDSAFFSPKIKNRFREELGQTMKQINIDLADAGNEIEQSLHLTADAGLGKDEWESVRLAMDEVKKIDLKKLVIDAINIPDLRARGNVKRHAETNVKPAPRNNPPAPVAPRKEELPDPDNGLNISVDVHPATSLSFELTDQQLTAVLNQLAEVSKTGDDAAILKKVKTLLAKTNLLSRLKVVPLVVKEKPKQEKETIISFQ